MGRIVITEFVSLDGVIEAPAELGLRRVVAVEVDRRGVLRQQRHPDVVRLGDRPPERVLVDVADGEVLEEAPAPAGTDPALAAALSHGR